MLLGSVTIIGWVVTVPWYFNELLRLPAHPGARCSALGPLGPGCTGADSRTARAAEHWPT